jgi:polysaccharide biosynthesis transport protein
MTALVETLSKEYEFVLIDAPALTTAADALVLGQMADGVLLTVKPGVVDTKSAQTAKANLQQSHQKILGIVMNGGRAESVPLNPTWSDPTVFVKRSH